MVTTFRHAVVPPPMCSFELQLPSPVNLVTFHCRPPRTNRIAALTSDGRVSVFVEGESVFTKGTLNPDVQQLMESIWIRIRIEGQSNLVELTDLPYFLD